MPQNNTSPTSEEMEKKLKDKLSGLALEKEEVLIEKAKKKPKKAKKTKASLSELAGVGEKTLSNLKEAGVNSLESLINLGVEGLTQIKGIKDKKAEKLISEAKRLKQLFNKGEG